MKKRGVLFVVFLFVLSSFVVAQYDEGPPEGMDERPGMDFDDMAQRMEQSLGRIHNCEISTFPPLTDDAGVSKVEIKGLINDKCNLIFYFTSGDKAEYMLSEEEYKNFFDFNDIKNLEECTGNCAKAAAIKDIHRPANEEEACTESCLYKNCDKLDFSCQADYIGQCEEECGIEKGPSVDNEFEQCMRDCVDSGLICQGLGPDAGGEQNPKCTACADKCLDLYGSGNNCLTEKQWEEREKSCRTCEHCYGEPIEGPSGDGYNCIIDARCFDASGEWGDDPGTGPDSWEPGHEPSADQVYWWDYEASLEISNDGETTLHINSDEEENLINFHIAEDIETDVREDFIVLKQDDNQVVIENEYDELLEQHVRKVNDLEEIKLDIEDNRAVYEISTKKETHLFGIIPVNIETSKKVDAHNLSLLEEEKPWWELFTIEKEEIIIVDVGCPEDNPFLCQDGTCTKEFKECEGCPLVKPFLCQDGTCKKTFEECLEDESSSEQDNLLDENILQEGNVLLDEPLEDIPTGEICKDTDNGLVYDKSGFVYTQKTDQGVSLDNIPMITDDYPLQDICLDGKYLKEFYCSGNQVKNTNYECTEICKNGQCENIEIYDVQVKEITASTATISWKTNLPTTSKVMYGEDGKTEMLNIKSSIPVENHEIKISVGLIPETTYNFRAVSCVQGVFCEQSEIMKFDTGCGGCFVDGVCYSDGQTHENGCQVCDTEVSISSWSNCYFQGTLRLKDTTQVQVDEIYKYSGCTVTGSVPNVDVFTIKNKYMTYECYYEGGGPPQVEFLNMVELPKAFQGSHGGTLITFTCNKGEMSKSSSGLPVPPPPKLACIGYDCPEEEVEEEPEEEEGPYQVCE